MDSLLKPIDLGLWLDADLIQRQNLLKSQFKAVFGEVGNAFSQAELRNYSPKAKGAKLSQGNDLLGFPYQVLDLVRDFDPNSGVNIRLLNWFGNGLFLTLFLGRTRENPMDKLLNEGFAFGLSESQWDYPDLILNQNQTKNESEISAARTSVYHWIKAIPITEDPIPLSHDLVSEVKKILGILAQEQELRGI